MENYTKLHTLLHNVDTPDYYKPDSQTIITIKAIVTKATTNGEDCLQLVNDLVRKHHLDTIDKDGNNYPIVKRFCLEYILRKHSFVVASKLRKEYNGMSDLF